MRYAFGVMESGVIMGVVESGRVEYIILYHSSNARQEYEVVE